MAESYFSEDYSLEEITKVKPEKNLTNNQIEIQSERYDINKPLRIIIKGKIIHGEDS
jgi:hypothetical protein